jgi:hypothetical protein
MGRPAKPDDERSHLFPDTRRKIIPLASEASNYHDVEEFESGELFGREQSCKIFLDTLYQSGEKHTKLPQHYQMAQN